MATYKFDSVYDVIVTFREFAKREQFAVDNPKATQREKASARGRQYAYSECSRILEDSNLVDTR